MDNLFVFRLDVHYGFEFGERYSIIPGIELDLVDEEHGVAKAIVYGVSFGAAFQRDQAVPGDLLTIPAAYSGTV